MAVVLLLSGCVSAPEQPDLQSIYREVARASEPGEHPLITVPGLLGSRLVAPDSGAVVWGGGARTGLSADPAVRFDLLAHPMGGLVARYYLMRGTAPLGEEGALPP